MKKLIFLIIFLIPIKSFSQKELNKVFVLGNSLTLGFGTHGMASTDINNDYFYLVKKAIVKENQGLRMKRFSGTSWEAYKSSEKRMAYLNSSVIANIDGLEELIIIQLGDNVSSTENLLADAKDLLIWFKNKCPNAKILWLYGWYKTNKNMPIIKQAVSEISNCTLVDISNYNVQKYQSKLGITYKDKNGNNAVINSKDIASHPGDLGMEMIANEILSVLKQN